MSQELLIMKDREAYELRSQVKQLSEKLQRALQMLRDRERENDRLNNTIAQLRDSAIQRDLDMTAVKQALGTRDAEAVSLEAQQRSTTWTLQKDLQLLQHELEEEKTKRMQLAEQKNLMEHDLRQHLRGMMEQSRMEQVSKQEGEAREAALHFKVDELQVQLLSKSRDVDAAVSALQAALEETQELQASHLQALHGQESHIKELQAQVLLLSESESTRSSEQQLRLGALVSSFNQLRETCEQQAIEINQISAEKRRLEEDKRVLKGRLTDVSALATSLKAEKDQVNDALNQQTSNLNSAHMELSIAQHNAREARLRGGGSALSPAFGDRIEAAAQQHWSQQAAGASGTLVSPMPADPRLTPHRSPASAAIDSSTHSILRAELALSKLRSSVGSLASPNKPWSSPPTRRN